MSNNSDTYVIFSENGIHSIKKVIVGETYTYGQLSNGDHQLKLHLAERVAKEWFETSVPDETKFYQYELIGIGGQSDMNSIGMTPSPVFSVNIGDKNFPTIVGFDNARRALYEALKKSNEVSIDELETQLKEARTKSYEKLLSIVRLQSNEFNDVRNDDE